MENNNYLNDAFLKTIVSSLSASTRSEFEVLGQYVCSSKARDFARIMSTYSPSLCTFEDGGRYINLIEYHPAYHALMRYSLSEGVTSILWERASAEFHEDAENRYYIRAIKLFLLAQLEPAHLRGLSVTNAVFALFNGTKFFRDRWFEFFNNRRYDPSVRPASEKLGLLFSIAGYGVSGGLDAPDKKNGSLYPICRSSRIGDHFSEGHPVYVINNMELFMSTPVSDGFCILSQTEIGICCLFVPRFLPDGTENGIRICNTLDKTNDPLHAGAVIRIEQSLGWLVGREGEGISIFREAQSLLNFDQSVIISGAVRSALKEAILYYKKQKETQQNMTSILISQRVLADMALDVVAMTALVMRLAKAYDRASFDRSEAAFVRVLTPVTRYFVGRITPMILHEIMQFCTPHSFLKNSFLSNLYRNLSVGDTPQEDATNLSKEVVLIYMRSPGTFETVLHWIESRSGRSAQGTLEVLRAAAAVASKDISMARLLVEQLALSVAAAELRSQNHIKIADCYLETRLASPWRFSYGVLNSRFSSEDILSFLYSDFITTVSQNVDDPTPPVR